MFVVSYIQTYKIIIFCRKMDAGLTRSSAFVYGLVKARAVEEDRVGVGVCVIAREININLLCGLKHY